MRKPTVGWKYCQLANGRSVIVKLWIPRAANVFHPTHHDKWRCDLAFVVALYTKHKGKWVEVTAPRTAWNAIELAPDLKCRYKVGSWVRPKYPLSLRNCACESGIHFHRTRAIAATWFEPSWNKWASP